MMRKLATEFTTGKRSFLQVFRTKHLGGKSVAVYEINEPQWPSKAYEVVIVQEHPRKVFMDRVLVEREGYPKPEQWGYDAWSPADEQGVNRCVDRAMAVLDARSHPQPM